MSINYLLFENAVGFSIFDVMHQADTVGHDLPEVRKAMKALDKFGRMVTLRSFQPWSSATQGLEAINMISEGLMPDQLKNTLELNLPQTSGKKRKVVLGLSDKRLAADISAAFPGVECESADTNEVVAALLRGLRLHADRMLKGLQDGDVSRAQLGLGHAYSRAKVKFSVHKNDNHIIQAIATLDALDKGINQGAMRVREWYGWHFPELIRIVADNGTYARVVMEIGDKQTLSDREQDVDRIASILGQDEDRATAIIQAAKISMGREIIDKDLVMIRDLAGNVSEMADYRRILAASLDRKMAEVAPNLQVLLGTAVAARLISHAGSLTNLSKAPASTVQILGAEKALFRALKTKGATPKYGLLYQSTFISRAGPKIKGRMSRYLANKCAMAARIDNFTEHPTKHYGEAMRAQLEERLEWYATGAKPTKNTDAMDKALKKVMEDGADGMDIDQEMVSHPPLASTAKESEEASGGKKTKKDKKDKKEKKEKKGKKRSADVNGLADGDGEHKKKKRKSVG